MNAVLTTLLSNVLASVCISVGVFVLYLLAWIVLDRVFHLSERYLDGYMQRRYGNSWTTTKKEQTK